MKKAIIIPVGLLLAVALHAQITIQEPTPQTATIEVNAAAVAHQSIPRTIFGTFLEPIGNSTYNGLWAEILQNPSFESGLWSTSQVAEMLKNSPELGPAGDLGLPIPWEPFDPHQGNRYELRYGDAANSWQSVRLFGLPGEAAGIRQKVYLPIHRTGDYVGSFYARHIAGDPNVTVEICAHGQKEALAAQIVAVNETVWTKYEFKLSVPVGKLKRLDPADFVMLVAGTERVDLDQLSLMAADAKDGLDPDAVRMARDMHTPLVRFGGNFTSSYHWRDGVGPRDRRRNMLNNSWGIPEYNSFGTDEFLAFCRQIGAQPQFALNLGSGSPEEAASWVKYIDEHWSTHSGLLWEMGNELWGSWNLAYPTRSELAARTAAFSKAIHEVDPTARLIATGADPEIFDSWNAIQLTIPAGNFEYLSTHFVVVDDDIDLNNPSPEFVQAASLAIPVELGRRVRRIQEQIDQTPGYKDKAHVAFTEWLFLGDHDAAPNFTNQGGALLAAGVLNMLLRNYDVVPISDMTGIMEFAGIWKKRSQVYASPAYYAFQLFAGADIDKPVAVEVRSGLYSVKRGVKRLPEIDAVPYLDLTAAVSKDGKTMTLFCVNRSPNMDIAARIGLRGFAAAPSASVQTLRANSSTEGNNEIDPTRVYPRSSMETVAGDGWTRTFPRASVTVIALTRK